MEKENKKIRVLVVDDYKNYVERDVVFTTFIPLIGYNKTQISKELKKFENNLR